jgi:spore coat protein U-like protein
MKRIIFGLALLLTPALASAQVCTTSPCAATNITTSLTVKSAVSFGAGTNLDFGVAVPGSASGVTAQGESATSGVAGSVLLVANQSVSVTAAFSDLTGPGAATLEVASTSCGLSTTSATSKDDTALFTCGTAKSIGTTAGTAGTYIWLGGSVSTATTTPAGTYAGTATVTGTYTAY